MPSTVNFDNGTQQFRINLNAAGDLSFDANVNGPGESLGDRRMLINDSNGQIVVGGGGQFGGLQLLKPNGGGTIFIGVDAPTNESRAFLGGGNSQLNGRVLLGNSAGASTIDMRGSNGSIRCVSLTETSDARLKRDVSPIVDALERVIALRGVRYEWKDEECSESMTDEGPKIGFIGQEVASVYPELVATDAEGHVSLNYSHMTAVLVEAIKEQQQLIQRQGTALAEALKRIGQLETAVTCG